VGNIVGSNIVNLGLILGLTATLARLPVDGVLARRDVPVLVITTTLLPFILSDGRVGRVEAGLLFASAIGLTLLLLKTPSVDEVKREVELVEQVAPRATPGRERLRLAGMTILGLVVLVAGGKLLVGSAVRVALVLGVSERIVGLTIVAVGTSLPELAASMVAALRGHGAIAVGNVLGSNVFNVLFVLGGAALARPVTVHFPDFAWDLVSLAPFTLWAAFMLRRKRSTAMWEGIVLCVAYLIYLVLLVRSGG
jgi:cation:H+ antiporter